MYNTLSQQPQTNGLCKKDVCYVRRYDRQEKFLYFAGAKSVVVMIEQWNKGGLSPTSDYPLITWEI